jgi:hypothetical protein
MSLAKLPPNRLRPDHHQILIDALERARKAVCCYSGPTCDCKYGLIGPASFGESFPLNAVNCKHRNCEHTGCPEIRDLIGRAREGQRRAWARDAEHHRRTPTHDWPCCDLIEVLELPVDSINRVCGGPGRCIPCTVEADRIHRNVEVSADTVWNDPDNSADAQQAGGL